MEENKKTVKLNKKTIILLSIIAIVIIVVVISIISIINKQQFEEQEELWKDKPQQAGDICINMIYYAQLVKDRMNSPSGMTMSEIKEKYEEPAEELYKQIKEQMEELRKQDRQMKNMNTPSQKKYTELSVFASRLYDKTRNIHDKLLGFKLLLSVNGRAEQTQVLNACEDVLQEYDNDIRYKIVYSTDNEEIKERKEYTEKRIVNKKHLEELRQKYFGYWYSTIQV